MPRTSGTFSLVPSYKATSGQTIRTEQHNPPLEDIAKALTDSMPRDGSAPMTGNLAMNGKRITGLGNGTAASDAVRRDQVTLYDAYLSSLGALSLSANRLPYASGAGVASHTAFTSVARDFLEQSSKSAQRSHLGLTLLDEDSMGSNSSSAVATQQSIKKYVDNSVSSVVSGMKRYRSLPRSFSSGGSTTFLHNFGSIPDTVQYSLVCESAEDGYSVGDEIMVDFNNTAQSYRFSTCIKTTTEIIVRFSDEANVFSVGHKSTGVAVNLNNSNWRFIVTALKLT